MLQEKQKEGFNQMLVYIEACHSGSMIDFLDNTWRIYATAAANSKENSYAVYCLLEVYHTCLGDGYSVAWMEDSDVDDVTLETIGTQFDRVKARVLTQKTISHVVEYGLMDIKGSMLSVFQGPEGKSLPRKKETSARATTEYETMSQDEVEVWYLKGMVRRAKLGSVEREEAQKQLDDVIAHRKHVDQSVVAIVRAIVDGQSNDTNATTCSQVLKGNTKAYTWDWKCFKGMIASYQAQCGTLRLYGKKYNQVFAKLCDIGISPKQLGVAARQICLPHLVNPQWMAEDKAGFYENPYV
ncbi:vacuolar-processing enzyme delta-isozyme-like [Silene latifolia]|uniref:vacuolar-processing enzyme delta-isozyme-like n=1 Tax=Silene latifolia TaxID=37657 RepID=UPI003D776741